MRPATTVFGCTSDGTGITNHVLILEYRGGAAGASGEDDRIDAERRTLMAIAAVSCGADVRVRV